MMMERVLMRNQKMKTTMKLRFSLERMGRILQRVRIAMNRVF
jgi:hypothetical protein